ncbi:MAG: DUF2335 domain-containing protein [Magnetococcus sp. MYC-9]
MTDVPAVPDAGEDVLPVDGPAPGIAILSTRTQSMWRSPIPPAAEMAAYSAIDPSLPDRIMTMAERQSAHRHTLELRQMGVSEKKTETLGHIVAKEQELRSRGQLFGFCLSLVTFGAILAALYLGQTTTANALVGIIVALALVFVTGQIFGNKQSHGQPQEPKSE